MNTEPKINDTRKAELLASTVEHIDIKSFDARPIVESMRKMSFSSRDLGRATDIYNQMLADQDCSVILVVAGSTLGMMLVNGPAVLLGETAAKKLPLKWIRLAAAAGFAATGLWILLAR